MDFEPDLDVSVRRRLSGLGDIFLELVARSNGGANTGRGNPGVCVCVCESMCGGGMMGKRHFSLDLLILRCLWDPPGGGWISGLKLRREQ